MNRTLLEKPVCLVYQTHPRDGIHKEACRKAIHITIACVPSLANWNMLFTVALLCSGLLCYIINEIMRTRGSSFGLISRLTAIASRSDEKGFIWGPVTLGVGTLATLLSFPGQVAALGIYALAFGDGITSLAGNLWGKQKKSWIGGKTFVGSTACLIAVFMSSYFVLHDFLMALVAAVVATILELIPLRDIDNLIIPLGTSLILSLIL